MILLAGITAIILHAIPAKFFYTCAYSFICWTNTKDHLLQWWWI